MGPVGRKNRGRLAPLGGMERTGRKERFARLIQRPVRIPGGPSARAACGGNLNMAWLPLTVIPKDAVLCLTEPASRLSGQFNDNSFSSSYR